MSSAEHSDQPAVASQGEAQITQRDVVARPYSAPLRIGAVLGAGALAWLFVQTSHPVFWSTQGMDDVGFLPVAVQWRLDSANTSLALGVWGGLIGIALALVQPPAARSRKDRLMFAVKAGGLATLCGALAGFLGHLAFESFRRLPDVSELAKAMAFNGVMLGLLGGGVGLTTGLLIGQARRSAAEGLVRGALAGVLASIVYLMALSAFVPMAMTTVLIPLDVTDRLLWFGLFSVFFAAIVAIPPRVQRSAAA
jgi:hypothetical protein